MTPLYLGHGISACHYATLATVTGEEREQEAGERACRELSGMSDETVTGAGSCVTLHVEPFFRYSPRESLPVLGQEHGRALVPRYRHARCSFLQVFASRQGGGYYVFSLREIIV